MSIASSRRRSVPMPIATLNQSLNTSRKKTIRFNIEQNPRVKDILHNYLSGTSVKEYEQLVCSIRDNQLADEELESVLKESNECIPILNQDLRFFVESILSLKWAHMPEHFTQIYRTFLIHLLCAHNYHTKYAIEKLILNFIESKDDEWENGVATDEDCAKYANVHSVLKTLMKVIPMSKDILYNSLVKNYPYIKKSAHQHEAYIHNMLWILDYQPQLKLEILYVIFNRLILLDTNAPREEILAAENSDEEIFEIETDKSKNYTEVDPNRTKHSLAYTLDICLDKIFDYIITECHDLESGQLNWTKTKSFYHTMLLVFDKVILPTYNIHHVQFVMFLLCSFKTTLCEGFVNHLWKIVANPNTPAVYRQTAVVYIASLLARGLFVPISLLKSTLEQLAVWIHKYISAQDGLENVNSDVRIHSVFYTVCQALFYLIAFRHKDLVTSKKSITFLESLNLTKMVTCRLNPLRVCQPAVLQNFAAVTRTYQLAYCYSIIEHNQRNVIPTVYVDHKGSCIVQYSVIDSFFPFDPFLLKRCGKKIKSIYAEYKNLEETQEDSTKMEEDNDFLNESSSGIDISFSNSPGDRFSYGTSPGFKYKS